MGRSLDTLYPPFREKALRIDKKLDAWCKARGYDFTARTLDTYRTAKEQRALYAIGRTSGVKGRIVTTRDGVKRRSTHQDALACDFVKRNPDGSPSWDAPEGFWDYLGHLARAEGLTWGGDWRQFPDRPHVEHPQSDRATYASARRWVKEQGFDK